MSRLGNKPGSKSGGTLARQNHRKTEPVKEQPTESLKGVTRAPARKPRVKKKRK
jgi:hypothetical protein